MHFLFYMAAAAFYKFKNNLNLDRTGTRSALRGAYPSADANTSHIAMLPPAIELDGLVQ